MNEQQRMQYLEAMGIEMFVPRRVLIAAKPSRPCLLPTRDVAVCAAQEGEDNPKNALLDGRAPAHLVEQEDSIAGPERAATRAVGGLVERLLDEQKASASGGAKNNPLELLASRMAAPEAVRFCLSLWRPHQDLLVVDTRHAKQALPTTTLLTNLLGCIGCRAALGKPDIIQWPLVENSPSSLQGIESAREMVRAFLSSRLEAAPAKYVWLMGEDACRVVADEGVSYQESVGTVLPLPGLGAHAYVLPSLTDLLLQPLQKKLVWNAVCSLRVNG